MAWLSNYIHAKWRNAIIPPCPYDFNGGLVKPPLKSYGHGELIASHIKPRNKYLMTSTHGNIFRVEVIQTWRINCIPHKTKKINTWWRHQMETFSAYWPFVRGIRRSPVNFPHKGQWRGALMFSLICAWINRWVNKREAGDLRRYLAHYDVTLMNIHVIILVCW